MKTLTALLALLAGLAAPLAVAAADLGGAWVIHEDFGPKARYDLLCALKQEGTAVSGPCMAAIGYVERASGALNPTGMELEYTTTYQGTEAHVTFQGRPQDDGSVNGLAASGFVSGPFEGAPLAGSPGAWLFQVSLGVQYQLFCALKASGETLRGPCAAVIGPTVETSGTTDGKTLSLAYDAQYAGQTLHVTLNGAIAGGAIKGTAADAIAKGAFTAKRR